MYGCLASYYGNSGMFFDSADPTPCPLVSLTAQKELMQAMYSNIADINGIFKNSAPVSFNTITDGFPGLKCAVSNKLAVTCKYDGATIFSVCGTAHQWYIGSIVPVGCTRITITAVPPGP